MSPDEEQALRNKVATLSEAVEAMRAELDLYRLNGLSDAFSGRGNQVFGGGSMRLDKNGIQIATHNTIPEKTALYFVDEFTDYNSTYYPKADIKGYSRTTVNDASLIEETMTSQAATAVQHAISGDDAKVLVYSSSTYGGAYLWIHASSAGQEMYITGAPFRFDSVTSDYTGTGDGYMWYRSDMDKVMLVANSVTESLATESWVHGDGSEKTIAAGVITVTGHFHTVDTESDAATDDLDTINGGATGQVIVLKAADGARDVVLKDGTGNLALNGDFTLNSTDDTIALIYDGTNWLELSRSDNA